MGRLCQLAFATLTFLALLAPGQAGAAFGIQTFDGVITADESGLVATQAGSHPYAVDTEIELNQALNEEGISAPDGSAKDLVVDLPPGLVGNPSAVPKCTLAELYNGGGYTDDPTCPDNTAVGVIKLVFFGGEEIAYQPIYNLVPGPGEPARFGFYIQTTPTQLQLSIRSGGDYGISVTLRNASQVLGLTGAELTFWGNPADPAHNGERGSCMGQFGPTGKECPFTAPPSEAQPVPFLTLPSSCSGPLLISARASDWLQPETWAHPDRWAHASFETHDPGGNPVGIEGCEELPFDPRLQIQPEAAEASDPVGPAFTLKVPQSDGVDGLATALVNRVAITLPPEMTLNSSAADGLAGCSQAEVGLGSAAPAGCPDSSKIGEVEIVTPVLEEPLTGALYVARQGDNPFGSRFAGYLVAEGSGVVVKEGVRVDVDPGSGQVKLTVPSLPRQPFSEMRVSLFGGPRAALKTPAGCGAYPIRYEIVPWSGGAPVRKTGAFEVGQGCETAGFDPKLSAGTTHPLAGSFAPFVFDLSREDGEQNLGGVAVTLPAGAMARLDGVPICSAAAAAAGSCPSGSRVGAVILAAGTGSSPLWVPQPGKAPTGVYLAGPYGRAPYSIVAQVPAQAGPFDLGTVSVRAAIEVDPVTAQVSIVSDRLPQIVEGVPVDYRRIQIALDRRGFMLNPTNCEPMALEGVASSAAGLERPLRERFQVGGCGELGLSPRLRLRFSGAVGRNGHPRIAVLLRPRPGDANLRRATVLLPRGEYIDPGRLGSVCTKARFLAGRCPLGSLRGRVRLRSSLLGEPLRGPVYLREGSRRLPDLVADLRGPVRMRLVAQLSAVHARVRATFANLPDVPVDRLELMLFGGSRGMLVNSEDLCGGRKALRATVAVSGHNGRRSALEAPIEAVCD